MTIFCPSRLRVNGIVDRHSRGSGGGLTRQVPTTNRKEEAE